MSQNHFSHFSPMRVVKLFFLIGILFLVLLAPGWGESENFDLGAKELLQPKEMMTLKFQENLKKSQKNKKVLPYKKISISSNKSSFKKSPTGLEERIPVKVAQRPSAKQLQQEKMQRVLETKESKLNLPIPLHIEQPEFDPKKEYNLSSLIDLALSENPETRAAWSRAKAASSDVGSARSLYYPWVKSKFVGGFDQDYMPELAGPNVFDRTQATVFFSIEYILFDFGRRDANVQRTLAFFNALGLMYQRKLQQVIFEVQKTYFIYEGAVWKMKADEAHVAFAQTLLTMAEREMATGLSAGPDVLEAKKRFLDAEYELEACREGMRNKLGDLCVAMGLPANTPLKVEETDFPASTEKVRVNVDELVKRALATRPDLAARVAELKKSRAETKHAISDFLPVVKLRSHYLNTTVGYDATNLNGGAQNWYNLDGASGFGGFITVDWDIFDGFDRVFKLKQHQEQDRVAAERVREKELETTRDVWTAYNNHLIAARQIEYAEGYVQSSRENFSSIATAVNSGLNNVTQYSEAESNLALSEASRAVAFADYSITLAALAFAVGNSTTPSTSGDLLGKPGKVSTELLGEELSDVVQNKP